MPRTRKYGKRSRATRRHRRRGGMKGGGNLDRLPVGPGARNEAGNPVQVALPAAPAAGGAGGAGAAAARLVYLGSPEALEKGRANAAARLMHLEQESPSAAQIAEAMRALPSNLQHTYVSPTSYKNIFGKKEEISDKFGIAFSMLNEANAAGVELSDLPELRSTLDIIEHDFVTNWDFKYVCGHGVLKPELPSAIVPARTYIRFHSPAGCVADISGEKTGLVPIMAFPDIFTKGSKEAFAKGMVNSFLLNRGPLESFSSKAERNALIENPYPPEFCTDPTNPLTESSSCLAAKYRKQTIYMPGESIPEMSIAFKNNPYETMILGVYNLPMDYNFYTAVQYTAENSDRAATKNLSAMTEAEYTAAIRLQDRLDRYLFAQARFEFRNEEGHTVHINNANRNPDLIGRTVNLSALLASLPEIPDGQVRFLFINSCRGVPRVMDDTGMMANVLGAWGAGAGAGPAGGAGGPRPRAKRPLTIAQRKEVAVHARRLSLGDPRARKDQALLEQVIEARKYMRTHPLSDPERAVKAALDSKIMSERMDIWTMAITMVPETDPLP